MQRIDGQNGQSAQYVYDADSYLKEVTTGIHQLRYGYDDTHRMSSITEGRREVGLHYDQEGRVVEVDFANHPAYRIRYTGETVEVLAPGATYTLELRDKFFHLRPTE